MMRLISTFAAIADRSELLWSCEATLAELEAMEKLKARETLRPHRSAAALRGVETRKGR